MKKEKSLHPGDWEFLKLLAESASINPFSDTYSELQMKIAACDTSVPADEQYRRVAARVDAYVQRMEVSGLADIRKFGDPSCEDARIVRYALMLDVYYRYLPQLDRLIQDQVESGDRPIPVPFAADIIGLLTTRGFSNEEALHYFAVLHQLRRAFFFIDRGLIGRSTSMKQLRRLLWNNVFTCDIRLYEQKLYDRMEDFSTLLLGETGSGKGAAAAAIGRSGYIPFDEKKKTFAESFTRSFTALNLSQFPESLIESELFGHRKGAFTGAIEAHDGVLARCSPHGAIFLDEIGEIGIPVQIKLLRVLQERSFTPVGAHEKLKFRGRIIAATNKPLATLLQSGTFREDFFYRLCSDIIAVPSLQQRIAEEPRELSDLIALIAGRIIGDTAPEIVNVVEKSLLITPGLHYAWPGNVRELEQAVRRILLTREYSGNFDMANTNLCDFLQAGIQSGELNVNTLLAGYCLLLYQRLGSYEAVAVRTCLDRRTVKSYIEKYDLKLQVPV